MSAFAEKCMLTDFSLAVNYSKAIRKTNTVCIAAINLQNRNSVNIEKLFFLNLTQVLYSNFTFGG